MQGERTPNIPSPAKDQMAFIDFMIDIKARKKWMLSAVEVIGRNEALLATIGKADEIEKLHAEAQALKKTVLGAIETREAALVDDRAAFAALVKKHNATFSEKQRRDSERLAENTEKTNAALAAATAAETAAKDANAAATLEQQRATANRAATEKLRAELKDQAERGRKLLNTAA